MLSVAVAVVDVAVAAVVVVDDETPLDMTSLTRLLTLFRLFVVLFMEAVVVESVVEQSVCSLLESLWLLIFPVGVVGEVGFEGECHPSSGLSWVLLLSEVELILSERKLNSIGSTASLLVYFKNLNQFKFPTHYRQHKSTMSNSVCKSEVSRHSCTAALHKADQARRDYFLHSFVLMILLT